MGEPTSARELFKGRHFDHEIIVLCVRWYLTFKLSSRDLVQMMAERGIVLAHTTILRWVQRYVPDFEKRWNHYARSVGEPWTSSAGMRLSTEVNLPFRLTARPNR
jgi:transposase-like protein